ncbi:hypothetical protein RUND412_001372 [Rhizina undulata]
MRFLLECARLCHFQDLKTTTGRYRLPYSPFQFCVPSQRDINLLLLFLSNSATTKPLNTNVRKRQNSNYKENIRLLLTKIYEEEELVELLFYREQQEPIFCQQCDSGPLVRFDAENELVEYYAQPSALAESIESLYAEIGRFLEDWV